MDLTFVSAGAACPLCNGNSPCFNCSTAALAESQPAGRFSKRLFDLVFSGLAIAAGAVLFVAIAVLIRLLSPGPIIFRHERIGFQGARFDCLKFRTMKVGADKILEDHLAANPTARIEFETTRKLRNDPRIIPLIGHFLRKSSLDEIPQFVNVLRGDMSVVGPRPVTRKEVDLYGPRMSSYLSARPGITGLWQVSGRNRLTFAERCKLDESYVRDWSFNSDMRIILRTGRTVLSGEGAF